MPFVDGISKGVLPINSFVPKKSLMWLSIFYGVKRSVNRMR